MPLAEQLVFTGIRKVARHKKNFELTNENQIMVKSLASAVSPGTERLIYHGAFEGEADPTLGGQNRDYPFSYGYALVGTIEDLGPAAQARGFNPGQRVFCFAPHGQYAVVDASFCIPIPDSIHNHQGLLYPFVETALTALWDGRPAWGERCAILGVGTIGTILSWLWYRQMAGTKGAQRLTLIDPLKTRRDHCVRFFPGANILAPQSIGPMAPGEAMDVCFELSGKSQGLQGALDLCRFGGRVVVASWYENHPMDLVLNGNHHRSRIELIFSQVSTFPQWIAPRMDFSRRQSLVWELIAELPEGLIGIKLYPFEQAYQLYRDLDLDQPSIQLPSMDYGTNQ